MIRAVIVSAIVVAFGCVAPAALGQNDWQFPDPHFGVAEFGRGRPGPTTERQYRVEIGPPGRYSAPGLRHHQPSPPPPRHRVFRPRARDRR